MTKKNPKITSAEAKHEMLITWPNNAFSGYGTKLTITKYESWSSIDLTVDGSCTLGIGCVPIDVLREIIVIHDALPPNDFKSTYSSE